MLVGNPKDREEYMKLKQKTSARFGNWKSWTRMRTEVLLRLRADLAPVKDVSSMTCLQNLLDELGLFEVTTECESRDHNISHVLI